MARWRRWIRALIRPAIGAVVAISLHSGTASITAIFSCPAVAPGGTAQITVMLPAPLAITHGRFTIDLDSAVFGEISAIHVFSASGDQQGVAKLQGRHAEVVFGANSGGIGRLPNLPVAEITVPVLDTAPMNATGTVMVQSALPWRDVTGKQWPVSFQSPGVTIGAGLSIRSVTDGGGPVAGGTVVGILGDGFSKSTKLRLEGVAWSNLQYVSPTSLSLTLTGPSDLTGKLFELTDEGGVSTRYYSDLTPTSLQDDLGNTGYFPIFPAATLRFSYSGKYFWLENDSSSPIDVKLGVSFQICTPCHYMQPTPRTVTVPAGGVYLVYFDYSRIGGAVDTTITASAPIRFLQGLAPSAAAIPELSPTALRSDASRTMSCNSDSNGTIVLNVQLGDPPTQPIQCSASFGATGVANTVLAGTDDGNSWLHASLLPNRNITVSVDPSGLGLGSHTGVVTASADGDLFGWAHSIFQVNVNPFPTISAQVVVGAGLYFDSFYHAPDPRKITVTSNSPSVPFFITSSDSWLTATPSSGTTPATVTVSAAPSTPPGKSATLTITGPGNTVALPAAISSNNYFRPVTFTAKAGSVTVLTSSQFTSGPLDLQATTESGGNWLSAAAVPVGGASGTLEVKLQADPSGLAAGQYHGTVTVTPMGATSSNLIPVTLSVWSDPTPLPVASILIANITQSGYFVPFNITTGSVALPFSVTSQVDDEAMKIVVPSSGTTPAGLYVGATSSYPGTYHGSITITAPTGSENSITIPVTLTVPPTPVVSPIRPNLLSVVNAGSLLPGPISPGEIVSVFGLVYTPDTAGLHIGPDGRVNRALYGNRVLFNGIAAPLTYLSGAQINAVVPYEIAGSVNATIEIDGGGVHSAALTVPVSGSAPGLFTQNGTGQGDGAILNQDFSRNNPQNPAARGSIIQIFLTGEGATKPSGFTGELTQLNTKGSSQAVSVQIGGVDARVVSATTAPEAIAGLFQVNALIPAGAPSGRVPVLVRIGNATSQSAATVSVQ